MRLINSLKEAVYEKEGRSVPIPIDEGVRLIKKECKNAYQAYHQGHMMYRGVNTSSADMLLVKPSQFTRVSANTMNLYTLIIDNSPLWYDYPKRSKSIICSTSDTSAGGYGELYIVFPKDGYRIGVCPDFDMWASFKKLGDLSTFNDSFVDFYRYIGISVKPSTIIKYNDLKVICRKIDDILEKEPTLIDDYIDGVQKSSDTVGGYVSFYFNAGITKKLKDYKGDMLKLLEKQFDPDKNNFFVATNIRQLPHNRFEVWTDSDCYMLREDKQDKMI